MSSQHAIVLDLYLDPNHSGFLDPAEAPDKKGSYT